MIYYWLFSLLFFIIAYFTKFRSRNKLCKIINASLLFLYGLITLLYFVANYFTGNGINFTVINTLKLGISNAGFSEYIVLILGVLFALVFFFFFAFFYYQKLNSLKNRSYKILKNFLQLSFLSLAFIFHPFNIDIHRIYSNLTVEHSKDFKKYYKYPVVTKNEGNDKNLLFIYLESFEKTYFDNSVFPGLAPNLSKLINNEGIDFINLIQTTGSGYTIAGMTSTQCGIPLFAPYSGNSMSGIDKFYPKAICLGDILKQKGYYLSFLQGSSTKFSGIDKFYYTHKFDEVIGREELINKLKDKSYLNYWGLYDDTMLGFLYNKFIDLSKKKKKFALFTITLDTHHPNGYLSKCCQNNLYKDGSNSILNTFHCSDSLIFGFIEKIKKTEFAKNTIIVLASDHLAMRNTASYIMDKVKDRKRLFVIFDLSEKKPVKIDKKITPMDVSPTVLSFLGIDTDLGLGRNILERNALISDFKDYSNKLYSWREDILEFWDFPKLPKKLLLNLEKSEVTVGKSKFKIPVLLKIDSSRLLPFFEEGVHERLFEQFGWLNYGDKFIYIDKCGIINTLFSKKNTTSSNDTLCIVQGKFGQKFKIGKMDDTSEYNLADFKMFDSNTNDIKKLKYNIQRLKKLSVFYHNTTLEEGIIFKKDGYPDFLEDVDGISHRENWGRWSDARLNPTVKFEFKNQLPDNFILELNVGAYGSNVNKNVKVKVGEVVKEFKVIEKNPRVYQLKFTNVNSKVIEIIPPNPTSPASIQKGRSNRKLGLSFIRLSIKKIKISTREYKNILKNANDKKRFIAHAGGAIDGKTYMDVLEALDANYKKGFRLFELDIIKTSDGKYVASHDWNRWKKLTGYKGKLPPSLEEFKKHKILGKYTPLSLKEINKWFLTHKDAVLVTDKINEPKIFSKQFTDKKRLFMELFSWKAVDDAIEAKIGGVMPTYDILSQIRGNKIVFLKNHKIKYIAASRRHLKDDLFFIESLKKNGIKVYAFHVNHEKGRDETYMVCNELNYFYGIYADNWDFSKKFDPTLCEKTSRYKEKLFYHATLKEGVVFNKDGYPDFIVNVEGISHRENWGRWSDTNLNPTVIFEFKNQLPGNFILELNVGAYGSNVNKNVKVKIGETVKEFKVLEKSPRAYQLKFTNVNSRVIEIIPPNPTSPATLQKGGSGRKPGLSFVRLSISKI